MAEPDSIERKTGNFALARTTFLQTLKPDGITAAQRIFDGLDKGEDHIFPDPASLSIADGWRNGAVKALERQFAAFVPKSAGFSSRI